MAFAAMAIVALTSCASGDIDSGEPSAVTSENVADPPASPTVVLPVEGQCWDFPTAKGWTLEGSPVDCSDKHTMQTAWVGELPETVMERPFTVFEELSEKYRQADGEVDYTDITEVDRIDQDAAAAVMESSWDECKVQVMTLIGADLPNGVTMANEFSTDVSGPSINEWDAGARWIRCNAMDFRALEGGGYDTELTPLPVNISGILRTPAGLAFNSCMTSKAESAVVITGVFCEKQETKNDTIYVTVSNNVPHPKDTAWVSKKQANKVAEQVCISFLNGYAKDKSYYFFDWQGVYRNTDGDRVYGFSKATWGTDEASFVCWIHRDDYQRPAA